MKTADLYLLGMLFAYGFTIGLTTDLTDTPSSDGTLDLLTTIVFVLLWPVFLGAVCGLLARVWYATYA